MAAGAVVRGRRRWPVALAGIGAALAAAAVLLVVVPGLEQASEGSAGRRRSGWQGRDGGRQRR
ncbi:MAG: hypothetical protein H6705_20590 [Myxococcales bacterium]|nr:hypothetical protein [Myxococcales bacterium]